MYPNRTLILFRYWGYRFGWRDYPITIINRSTKQIFHGAIGHAQADLCHVLKIVETIIRKPFACSVNIATVPRGLYCAGFADRIRCRDVHVYNGLSHRLYQPQ